MAGEAQFKVGDALPIVYQAPNAESGLAGVIAEIFLPTGVKNTENFPDVAMGEVLNTGTYKGQFTPNVTGEWLVIVHKADGNGKVIKRYSVGNHNLNTVGTAVDGVNTAVGTVDGKVTTVDGKVDGVNSNVTAVGVAVVGVDGKVTTVDGKVTAVDGKADAILTAVNNIGAQVGGLDTPAMVS